MGIFCGISIRLVVKEVMHAVRMLLGHYYASHRYIQLTIDPRLVSADASAVKHNYYLTTKAGICALRAGKLYQLTRTNSYGLSFAGDFAYCSLDKGHFTCVIRFPRRHLDASIKTRIKAQVVYGILAKDMRGRIHQVTSVAGGAVWIANTSRNTLLKVTDNEQAMQLQEFAPLVDALGAPILFDHNHINSVVDYGGYQLFSAFKAGSGAMLGLICGQDVTGFFYKNYAIHDIYLTHSGFVLCDMLGDADTCGGLVTEKGFDNDVLQPLVKHHAIRGLAMYGDETLAGFSVKKEKHNERMKGNARVVVMDSGKAAGDFTIPFSQIYQIVHESGEIITPVPHKSYEEVYTLLERCFGAPVYQGKLLEVSSD